MHKDGAGFRWVAVAWLAWGAASFCAAEGGPPAPMVPEEPEFGTASETAVEVHAFAFQAEDTHDRVCSFSVAGYRTFCSTPDGIQNPHMAAAVQLPSGVVIDFLKFSAHQNTSGHLEVALYDNGVNGAAPVLIGALLPTVTGWFNASASLNYTYAQSAHHPLYLEVSIDGMDEGYFNNVQIYYHRIVSPGPATATFTDVPTNHPFFKFVEALVAAGITAGYGDGRYGVNDPITRGQMAVFLSSALGLHWPF